MFRLHDIEPRDPRSKRINVVIDTPRGSRNKYKYDEKLGVLRLSRILPVGMTFPFDFGSVPRTLAEDGDALDVLVLMDAPTFPGCLVSVRLLGALVAIQRKGQKIVRNDRLIAVPETPVNRPAFQSLDDVGKARLDEIAQFFVSYNRIQGREFKLAGRRDAKAAETILKRAMRAFADATPGANLPRN
jgi:inorganic pyrophosphatase